MNPNRERVSNLSGWKVGLILLSIPVGMGIGVPVAEEQKQVWQTAHDEANRLADKVYPPQIHLLILAKGGLSLW